MARSTAWAKGTGSAGICGRLSASDQGGSGLSIVMGL
jgi:hypothetical protein